MNLITSRTTMPALMYTLGIGFLCTSILTGCGTTYGDSYSRHVDKQGSISLPANFRLNMSHLGSWFVPDGDASGFHDVYTEPTSIEAFRKNGKFPDGATLVKELRAHSTGDYSTGAGVSYADDTLKQWFVMVKDSNGRFPDNKSWGDGWGWALFQPGKEGNVSSDYKSDCLGCHIPARNNDWIYVEGYPTLGQK